MLKVFCVRVKTRRKQTKSSRVTAAFDVMGIVLLYSIPIKILIWVIFISVFKRPLRVVMFQPPVNYNQRDKPKQFSAPSSVCKTKTKTKKRNLIFTELQLCTNTFEYWISISSDVQQGQAEQSLSQWNRLLKLKYIKLYTAITTMTVQSHRHYATSVRLWK